MKQTLARNLITCCIIVLVAAVACDGAELDSATIDGRPMAATAPVSRVLGFENAADWSRVYETSSVASEGSASAVVQPKSLALVWSVPLSTVVSSEEEVDAVSVDVLVNEPTTSRITMQYRIRSLGIYWTSSGRASLEHHSPGVFKPLVYNLPLRIKDVLSDSYNDFQIRFVLYLDDLSTPIQLDNIRFGRNPNKQDKACYWPDAQPGETACFSWAQHGSTSDLTAACGSELNACLGQPECMLLRQCTNDCWAEVDVRACQQECKDSFSDDVVAVHTALEQCIYCDACDLACAGGQNWYNCQDY